MRIWGESSTTTRGVGFAAIGLAAILLGVIFYFSLTAGAIIERGDGVNHYLLARWSWAHPQLLLDHWGKPLFILLASPFAQLGMHGVVLFNITAALVAVLFTIRITRLAGPFAMFAYPIFLLLAPLYVLMILAGMTEPLFGTLTVVAVALFHSRRYLGGTIVASFLPFARPEFVAFLPFAAAWLALAKRWRLLPLLGTGWIIYALIGWAVFDDFNWYVHSDPYDNGPSIYGSGDPWMFVRGLDNITGRPLMVFFLLALLSWPYLRWKDPMNRRTTDMIMILCALPVISILGIHMTLWGLGIKGSAGILRVVSTAVPLAALVGAYVLPRVLIISAPAWFRATRPTMLLSVGLIAWGTIDFYDRQMLPIKANSDEQALRDVGEIILPHLNSGAKLFTTHPFMAICADVDPFDNTRYEMTYGYEGLSQRMRPGDIMFWDNELGPNESGIPFDSLWHDENLELVVMAEPTHGHKVIRGVYYELFAFRRSSARREAVIDTLVSPHTDVREVILNMDTVHCADPDEKWCLATTKQPMVILSLPLPPEDALLDEYVLSMIVQVQGTEPSRLALVYDQWDSDSLVRTRQEELDGGLEEIHLRLPPVKAGSTHEFRLTNPSLQSCTISNFRLVRKRWRQHSLAHSIAQ
ncbi:MAG: hypothetical protein IPP83_09900 [Flavobacteriales bacterium]|nr:hypothetical protein [Flavobacteriales bacterium]